MGIPAGMLPHTVTRIRPSTSTDAHNTTVRTYGATGTSMAGWLQQDQRTETRQDGRTPLEQLWLLITNDSDINATDRIVFGSDTYEVEGVPAPKYTPAGYHHTETTLRKLDG